jgi:hypothetical protein
VEGTVPIFPNIRADSGFRECAILKRAIQAFSWANVMFSPSFRYRAAALSEFAAGNLLSSAAASASTAGPWSHKHSDFAYAG